jgi:16S rRNA (cytosine1402-N4)-methyltransferase
MPAAVHQPVLLDAAIRALAIRANGIYIDATFGRGGHSAAILSRLGPSGRLIALDRDPSAARAAQRVDDARFMFHQARFSELPRVLGDLRIFEIDGLLLDLGVSSPQFDEAARGFSFRSDGPLDMRMNPAEGMSAAEWIAHANERELTEVIADYGEERFAQSIARAIVAVRSLEPIVTTRQLAEIVAKAVRARQRPKPGLDPATRTFQAIRIFVNQELAELTLVLTNALPLLADSARLAVISFHSLEDRIVKQFMRRHAHPEAAPELARLPLRGVQLPQPTLRLIGRAVKADAAEVIGNPRARSAVLRVAERIHAQP